MFQHYQVGGGLDPAGSVACRSVLRGGKPLPNMNGCIPDRFALLIMLHYLTSSHCLRMLARVMRSFT